MRSRFALLTISAVLLAATCADAAEVVTPPVAVAPQYDTAHVYVDPADFDRFAASFLATFGGTATKRVEVDVTPTPSSTLSQLLQTPVGSVSVFGFTTPVPAPFGAERTGYFVTDMDKAIAAARATGADVIVAPFPDPIGRDAVIQWPGGIDTQLYWHTTAPSYAPLTHVPDNRVYVSSDRVEAFLRSFTAFAHGTVASDVAEAPGAEIGRPDTTYRRVIVTSNFGRLSVATTDGHLPYPYGHETTGYAVDDLAGTLAKAKASGATVLVDPATTGTIRSAMVAFPGGYIAEIHAAAGTP